MAGVWCLYWFLGVYFVVYDAVCVRRAMGRLSHSVLG